MRAFNIPKKKFNTSSHTRFVKPLQKIFHSIPLLESRGYRPLKMTFEDQLQALIFFHLQEHESARDLIQHLEEDDFAKECIAPSGGISRSSFSEIINSRGLKQLEYVFQSLCTQAQNGIGVKSEWNWGQVCSWLLTRHQIEWNWGQVCSWLLTRHQIYSKVKKRTNTVSPLFEFRWCRLLPGRDLPRLSLLIPLFFVLSDIG
ncbi:hypothetical protein [Desulfobacterium sp. N47]|uniref:hypothetical protein n=1 Tax=Desulfobacterium sp. N47 TaxID=3115210 RepID=UPI003F4A1E1B